MGLRKDAICANCQYSREPGQLDASIPGSGNWCSNLKSPRKMTRVAAEDSCDGFTQRGKRAPIKMRVAIKAVGTVNKQLAKLSEKRHRKRKRK